MPLYKTEAIVLAARPFGDTSKLLLLLTPNRGVQKAIAKGARRSKSRLAGATVVFRVIEALLYLREGRELATLSEATIRWAGDSFGGQEVNWRLFWVAGELSEIALAAATTDHEHHRDYRLFRTTLDLLDGGINPSLARLFYTKRLLISHGIWPDFTRCAHCGANLTSQRYLDIAEGQVLCGEDAVGGQLRINAGAIALLDGLEKRAVLSSQQSEEVVKNALEIVNSLLNYHFDIRPRARGLLESAEQLLRRERE